MIVRVGVLLLIAAASALASVWRINFAFDRILSTVPLDKTRLHDISFDVDHKTTSSGFIEFYLENGTVGNFRRRVRRKGDCHFSGQVTLAAPYFVTSCRFTALGLVARYDVEVIADGKTERTSVEAVVFNGSIIAGFSSHFGDCTKCTKPYTFQVESVSAKLLNFSVPIDLPGYITKEIETQFLNRVQTEIAHALNTTYKEALEAKMAPIKANVFAY
ncbi:uncharacterized protein LOC144103972 isoform X1 [Amblyomma americanum]